VDRLTAGTRWTRLAARFRHHLCAVGILYLVPIGIAVAFYVLVSVWLGLFGDSFGIDRLIALQRLFENVSQFFSDTLQLDESRIFLALVGIYLIGCLLLTRRDSRIADRSPASLPVRSRRLRLWLVSGLHRAAEGYCRYSNPIAAGLAVLASFTFFGLHLGAPSHDLQLRLKTAQQGYAEVAARTEAALSQRITFVLFHQALDALPADYRDALRLPDQIAAAAADTRAYTAEVRRKYGIADPAVETVVHTEQVRQATADRLKTVLVVPGGPDTKPAGDLPNGQLGAARSIVADQPPDPGVELVSEGRRKVVLQVQKLVSERLVSVVKPLVDAFPVLGPVLGVLTEAVDETAQEKLDEAYQQVVREVVRNPREFTGTVQRGADRIAAHTDVAKLAAQARPAAEQQAGKLRRTLAALTNGKARLERRVADKLRRDAAQRQHDAQRRERAQVEALAGRLVSSDQGTQIDAGNELINLSDEHFVEEVIDRVLTTMRTSTGQVRVNAARIIGELGPYEPQYIPPPVVREAKAICGCH
jgi:hypothetical protein